MRCLKKIPNFFHFFSKKVLTKLFNFAIILFVVSDKLFGSLAQLGEHLPYKQRVTGSSPVTPTTYCWLYGPVVQLVRTLACHARGREFEPHPDRQMTFVFQKSYASVAQSVEQGTENPCVGGSIPPGSTICGSGSVVERHLAKVNVASSNLVFRSKKNISGAYLPPNIYINIYKRILRFFIPGAIAKW